MTTKDRGPTVTGFLRWTPSFLLLAAPLAQAQLVLTGTSTQPNLPPINANPATPNPSTIGYTLYPSPGITEAFIQVGSVSSPTFGSTGVTTASGQAAVLTMSFLDTTSTLVASNACGAGCQEQVLNGSGSLLVTGGASFSGTFGNFGNAPSAIFAAPGSSTVTIQLDLSSTSAGAPEYLLLTGTTSAPVTTCAVGSIPGFCQGGGVQYFSNFSLVGNWTATVSATAFGAGAPPSPPPAGAQVYLNSANVGSANVSWSTPANPWLLGSTTSPNTTGLPAAGNDVFVINTTSASGFTTVQYDAAVDPQLHSLTVDSTGGAGGNLVTLLQAANALTSGSETIGTTGLAVHQQSGGVNNVGGVLTINAYGTYDLKGGALTAGAIRVNDGTFISEGGTVAFTQFAINGGSATNSVGFTSSGTMNIAGSGGNPAIAGAFSNTATGSLANAIAATISVSAGGLLDNAGLLLNNGAISANAGGALTNENGATLTNSGALAIDGVLVAGLPTGGVLTNFGTLSNVQGGTFSNTATVNNYANLTNSGATLTNHGALDNVNATATLANEFGASIVNAGSGSTLLNAAGATLVNGAQLIAGTAANPVLINGPAGIVNSNGASLINTGMGTTLDNQFGSTLGNYAALNNASGATLSNSAFLVNGAGGTLTNSGIATSLAGRVAATLDNSASGNILNTNSSSDGSIGAPAGVLVNSAGGLLHNAGSITNDGGAAFYNYGVVAFTTNPDGTPLIDPGKGTFSATVINDAGGTLTNTGYSRSGIANPLFSTLVNRDGGILTNTGSTLDSAGDLIVSVFSNTNGAQLTNSSTINNSAGASFNNSGVARDASGTALVDGLGNVYASGVTNSAGGTINNSGFALRGTALAFSSLNNAAGAILINTGAGLDGSGATQRSSIANGNGATIENTAMMGNFAGAGITNDGYAIGPKGVPLLDANGSPYFSTIANAGGGLLINSGYAMVGNTVVQSLILNGNYGRLTNDGAYRDSTNTLQTSTLTNSSGAVIANIAAVITNSGGAQIVSEGAATDAATGAVILDSQGQRYASAISNAAGGAIINTGYFLDAANTLTASSITNSDGAQLINAGAFLGSDGAIHSTLIENAGGAVIVNSSAQITNGSGGHLYNHGVATDASGNVVLGPGFVKYASTISNALGGDIENSGYYLDSRNIVTQSTLTNSDGATVLNAGASFAGGTLQQSMLSNQNGGLIANSNSASIVNRGGALVQNLGVAVDVATTQPLLLNGFGYASTVSNTYGAEIRNNGYYFDGTHAVVVSEIDNRNGATLANDGVLLANGALTRTTISNQVGALIANYGLGSMLTNRGGAYVENVGVALVDSTLQPLVANGRTYASTLSNAGGAMIENGGFYLDGNGTPLVSRIDNRGGAAIINDGGYVDGGVLHKSTIVNTGGGQIASSDGSTLVNRGGASIQNAGFAVGSGSLVPITVNGQTFASTLSTAFGGSLTNSGFYQNGNDAPVVSRIDNRGGAMITNDGAGPATVNGPVLRSTITNEEGAIIANSGPSTIVNSGGAWLENRDLARDASTLQPLTVGGQTYSSTLSNTEGGRIINTGVQSVDGAVYRSEVDNGGTAVIINDGFGRDPLAFGDAGYHRSQLSNDSGAVLSNTEFALITNSGGALVVNDGTSLVLGQTYHATLSNTLGGSIVNRGALSAGANSSQSEILNAEGAELINDGMVHDQFGVQRSSISNDYGALIYNSQAASIVNSGGALLRNEYTYADGKINFASTVFNTAGSTITNTGVGKLDGTIYVSEIMNFSGAVLLNDGGYRDSAGVHSSTISNTSGGSIVNALFATITNSGGALLQNMGTTGLDGQTYASTLSNTAGATIVNTGYNPGGTNIAVSRIENSAGAAIVNDGAVQNGALQRSTLSNADGATISNVGAMITNSGGALLENSGLARDASGNAVSGAGGQIFASTITNAADATITNTGVWSDGANVVSSTLSNRDGAAISNFGNLQNLSGAVLANSGGTVNNAPGGTLLNSGYVLTTSTLTFSELDNSGGGAITNSSAFIDPSAGTIARGTFANGNGAVLYNSALITNSSGGLFENLGTANVIPQTTLQNSLGGLYGSTLVNQLGGSIVNTGALVPGTMGLSGGGALGGAGAVNTPPQYQSLFTNSGGASVVNTDVGSRFTNLDGGRVVNDSRFTSQLGAKVLNTGLFTQWVNENAGKIVVQSGADFSNSAGASVTNDGATFAVGSGGTIHNTGNGTSWTNTGAATVTIESRGILSNEASATLINDGSMIVATDAGSALVNAGDATVVNRNGGQMFILGGAALRLASTGPGIFPALGASTGGLTNDGNGSLVVIDAISSFANGESVTNQNDATLRVDGHMTNGFGAIANDSAFFVIRSTGLVEMTSKTSIVSTGNNSPPTAVTLGGFTQTGNGNTLVAGHFETDQADLQLQGVFQVTGLARTMGTLENGGDLQVGSAAGGGPTNTDAFAPALREGVMFNAAGNTSALISAGGTITNNSAVTIYKDGEIDTFGSYVNNASTLLLGGTLKIMPNGINTGTIFNKAGSIGGTGSLVGNVIVFGGSVKVGASPDPLAIHGSYLQSGGTIGFEVDPGTAGAFLESTLVFDPGQSVSITGTDIVFDFASGADPFAFLGSGQFNLDTFFRESDGSAFSTDFALADLFGGDTFQYEIGSGPLMDLSLDAATGNLSAVPEPPAGLLLLTGLGIAGVGLGSGRRRRGRLAAACALAA